MSELIQNLINNREAILIGEIGALLHDIGKCHPNFIRSKSIGETTKDCHTQIDKFLNPELVKQIENGKFQFKIAGKQANISSIIRKHHDRDTQEVLVKLLESCDRLDSADDKGIVREKQSIENTVITSPFGYSKEKIDLKNLEESLVHLSDELIDFFGKYISNSVSLAEFRGFLIETLEKVFTHVLGETRIPSNDVTLWDHSHSTASLFKTLIIRCILEENIDTSKDKEKWRVIGFCWDGIEFINKGKKIADIWKRNEIIECIKKELKKKFEDEIPIGNAIYEDINSIYFTFPDFDKSEELAKECAKIGFESIMRNSENEIWPFFTLSKASRTLTILADELRFVYKKRKIPKTSPILFVEQNEDGEKILENPDLPTPQKDEDICPVCKFRTKHIESDMCNICKKRVERRLQNWLFADRRDTIWIDEVADKNNRIALLNLSFDIDKWLDGSMIGTFYSQSFEDWHESRAKEIEDNAQFMRRIEKSLGRKPPKNSLRDLAEYFMDYFVKEALADPTFSDAQDKISLRTKVFNTLFEDINVSEEKKKDGIDNPLFIKNMWEIFSSKLTDITSKNILSLTFTQNPSPARLFRIWNETNNIFDLIISEIKDKIYSIKWKRITFSVDISNIKTELKHHTPYTIKISNLETETLLVFHSSNGKFYTIESLDKFKLDNIHGADAIKKGLENIGFCWLENEDKPNENLLENSQIVKCNDLKIEEYCPLIEITKSPLSLRMIVPASDSIEIAELVLNIYNERFEKIIGKLPLNIGLLIAKSKFPLSVLLDSGERILKDENFRESVSMEPWWDVKKTREDKHYSFYPINKKEKYTLDDLAQLSEGKSYTLYPGYFDFDLLLATTDRYEIYYKKGRRESKAYGWLMPRPYYMYQSQKLIDLWKILYANLSTSQINFIEMTLSEKLREWINDKDINKEFVFREFAEATLKDAFAENWTKLGEETRNLLNSALKGFLLDTITLFIHTLKVKEGEKNE
ncbi:MAG: CRISPR-associated protein Csx11 [Candidatus Jordarchaeum sp.]|uniref:CRISPR-associated protein Csx11 n=1 Tax=Candidatus Jordarchaeum sp. TaxID=2823881 RepID=UPI00404A33E6